MKLRTLQKRMVALSIHLCGVVTNCGQWGLLIFRRWWPLASTFLGLSHIADTYFWTMVMVALSIHLCGVVTNCGQWGLLLFRRWWPLASTFLGLSHIADKYFWTMVMVALSIHLCGVVTNCGQWGLLLFRRWWPLASTFLGLSHIADKYFWTMVMVARSIHLCGVVTCDTKYVLRWGCVSFQTLMVALRALLCAVVTYSAPIFLDNEWSCIVFRSWWWPLASTFVELSQNPRAYALTLGMCMCDNEHCIDMRVNSTEKNSEQKISPRTHNKHNSIHPFVCFSACCHFFTRTLTDIMHFQVHDTYCTHSA